MATAIITLYGKMTDRIGLPGRPATYDGVYTWTPIPIFTTKDFGRLVRDVSDAVGLSNVSNDQTYFEIIIHARETITDDYLLVTEIGKIVQEFRDNAKASR